MDKPCKIGVAFTVLRNDLNWEKRSIVCLSVWFHTVGMILIEKNNPSRGRMLDSIYSRGIWIEKNSPSCAHMSASIQWGWFELRKTPHRVPDCLIQFSGYDFDWENLSFILPSVWFHSVGMIWINKNSPSRIHTFDSIRWGFFPLRKLPIVYMSLCST